MNRYGYQFSFVCVSVFFLFVGCGPNDLAEIDLPIPAETETVSENIKQTMTVKVAKADAASPAEGIIVPPPIDAAADEICRRFLQELNRENPDQFKLFLTSPALNVASRLRFDLPPVADADQDFVLSPPRFASIRNTVCYVDCRFGDNDEKISWMLKKTSAGWRIAGMLVPGKDGTSNLLSFENSFDVAQIRDSLTSDVSADVAPN